MMADPSLEHSASKLHNNTSSKPKGVVLDLQRLKELEKLAGLQLAPLERTELLADLFELEKIATQLPDLPSVEDDSTSALPHVNNFPPALAMDRTQVGTNAPSLDDLYFKTPPTKPRTGGSSS